MSGIALTEFKVIYTVTPETCRICGEELAEGLEHKVDSVAQEQFDRFHEKCLARKDESYCCPICHLKVETITRIDQPVIADTEQEVSEEKSEDAVAERESSVICAALCGHPNRLRTMLKEHPISEDTRKEAFVRAAEQGFDFIADVLEEDYEIPEECRGIAVIAAAQNGRISMLHHLLQRHTISRDNLEVAIQTAAHPQATIYLERVYRHRFPS